MLRSWIDYFKALLQPRGFYDCGVLPKDREGLCPEQIQQCSIPSLAPGNPKWINQKSPVT